MVQPGFELRQSGSRALALTPNYPPVWVTPEVRGDWNRVAGAGWKGGQKPQDAKEPKFYTEDGERIGNNGVSYQIWVLETSVLLEGWVRQS